MQPAPRSEMRPWLVEADGSRWKWEQYPGVLTPPEHVTGGGNDRE